MSVLVCVTQRVVVGTLGRIIRDRGFGVGTGVCAGVEEYSFLSVGGDDGDTVGVGKCKVGIKEKKDARHGAGEGKRGMEF